VHLRLYLDDTRPEGIPGHLVHEATTDEQGVVSFPWRDEYAGCHFVFDRVGYAPHVQLGGEGDRIELSPGRTWFGRLLDAEGEPLAGVRVEYYRGCPHAPALRTWTTDTNGNFALWSIGSPEDGFLWALAPGTTAWALSLHALPVPGDVCEPVLLEPGVTVTGTAYDASGGPARGAVVYSTQDERGPKVRTAEDGSFTLVGVAPDAEVLVAAPGVRLDMTRTEANETPPPPAPPPPATVRVHAPDQGFLFFAIGDEGSVDPDEDGRVELTTTLRGPVRIDFRHEQHGDGRIVADVNAAEVDVPPTAFRVPGVVIVPEGVDVAVLDDTGGWGAEGASSWYYRPGGQVRLERDGCTSNYRLLRGRGPYVLTPGAATLDIRTGDAPGAVCWVDGERFMPGPVRGLDAGAHTVLVGAPGRVGKVGVVTLSDGETKTLDLHLDKE